MTLNYTNHSHLLSGVGSPAIGCDPTRLGSPSALLWEPQIMKPRRMRWVGSRGAPGGACTTCRRYTYVMHTKFWLGSLKGRDLLGQLGRYIYSHTRTYICTYTHTHTHIHTYTYVHTYICHRLCFMMYPVRTQTTGPEYRSIKCTDIYLCFRWDCSVCIGAGVMSECAAFCILGQGWGLLGNRWQLSEHCIDFSAVISFVILKRISEK